MLQNLLFSECGVVIHSCRCPFRIHRVRVSRCNTIVLNLYKTMIANNAVVRRAGTPLTLNPRARFAVIPGIFETYR